MNKIETHPFEPFIPQGASSLIVGSFPGIEQVANRSNPEEWFYSASDNLFWPILSEVFSTELKNRAQKENLLNSKGIAITDIFTKVRRKENSNLDKYLFDFEYNKQIVSIIEGAKIKKLFFTSRFVEKHFLREFPHFKFGICLPSPSPAANIPISKSNDYKIYKELNPNGNTQSYRVYRYKQLLQ